MIQDRLALLLAEVRGKGAVNDRNSRIYYKGYADGLEEALRLLKIHGEPKTAASPRRP